MLLQQILVLPFYSPIIYGSLFTILQIFPKEPSVYRITAYLICWFTEALI